MLRKFNKLQIFGSIYPSYKLLIIFFIYMTIVALYAITGFPMQYIGSKAHLIEKIFFNTVYFGLIYLLIFGLLSPKSLENHYQIISILLFVLILNRFIGLIPKFVLERSELRFEVQQSLFVFYTLLLKSIFMGIPIYFLWNRISPLTFRKLFTIKKSHIKYYVSLIIFMVPIIYYASLNSNFLKIYPRYSLTIFENQYHPFLLYTTFYIVYLANFIVVELYFRGALVINRFGSTEFSLVISMSILYSIYHLGKPVEELVSALFGGIILGVIAYRTRSILGGIIVHVSIALLMDFFAFLSK